MWISWFEKPLHHWSNALKSSFAKNWNRVAVKFWSQHLQYLQSHLEIFIHHSAAAVPLLETYNISPVWPVCRYIIEIWPVLMACTWKNCVLLAVFWDKIFIFGPNGAPLGARWWCTLRAASRSYLHHLMSRYRVNARNRAESTERSRFPPPCADFCWVGSPRAGRVFQWAITQPIVRDDPWHHIDLLCIRALTSARAFAAATCRAGPRARRHRSLNILTAREPMGLSSRRRSILLASHRMALTEERKNPILIAREIEISSIFAWLVPTMVPKHNSRLSFLQHNLLILMVD